VSSRASSPPLHARPRSAADSNYGPSSGGPGQSHNGSTSTPGVHRRKTTPLGSARSCLTVGAEPPAIGRVACGFAAAVFRAFSNCIAAAKNLCPHWMDSRQLPRRHFAWRTAAWALPPPEFNWLVCAARSTLRSHTQDLSSKPACLSAGAPGSRPAV
jgi:hypothetical protein